MPATRSDIGIGGYSQGGSGTIHAVAAQDNGSRYKVMYAASAPTLPISVDLLKAPFDISGVNTCRIPFQQSQSGGYQATEEFDHCMAEYPLWCLG